jgi:hypothetical protein
MWMGRKKGSGGVETDQRVRLVEELHGLPALVDFHFGRLLGTWIGSGFNHGNDFAGAIEALSRVPTTGSFIASILAGSLRRNGPAMSFLEMV